MRRTLVVLFLAASLSGSAQYLPDTCLKMEPTTILSGRGPCKEVMAPREQLIGFSVFTDDTTWTTLKLDAYVKRKVKIRYREHRSPNCPWLWRLEHVCTPCK